MQPQFSAEALEQLIPGPVTPAELESIFQQFKKAVLERALGAEMSHHLGYTPGESKPEGAPANHRNGKGAKTVLTDVGALRIDVPRDREDVSARRTHLDWARSRLKGDTSVENTLIPPSHFDTIPA